MENNYFIPSIEDIRVGYECEIWWNYNAYAENEWCSVKALEGSTEDFDIFDFIERIQEKWIRVPYLTKEQIEAEGWKCETQSLGNYIRGTKKCLVKQNRMGTYWDYSIPSEFQITYDTKNFVMKIMYVSPVNDLTLFEGECKDINTFRYICKLLNI